MATAQGANKRPRGHTLREAINGATKRSKKAESDNEASASRSSQPEQPKTIFHLPAELRNAVYEYYFDDLVTVPQQPFDELPKRSRFEQYVKLLQTSRQVHSEARSLFLSDYVDRVVFYFEHSSDLVEFMDGVEWEILPNARFLLRQPSIVDIEHHGDVLQGVTESLWGQQPGFNEEWLSVPTYYLPYEDNPSTWFQGWKPEDHDFQYLEKIASNTAWGPRKPYKMLRWPMLENRCQLIAYSWADPPLEGSYMTFEGRLADLHTEDFDLFRAKAALAHTQGVRCECEPCHVCDGHPDDIDGACIECACNEEDESVTALEDDESEEMEDDEAGAEDVDYGTFMIMNGPWKRRDVIGAGPSPG